MKALEAVIDPELRRSNRRARHGSLDRVRRAGLVDVTVSLTTSRLPDPRATSKTSVPPTPSRKLDGVEHVNVFFDVMTEEQKAALQQKLGRGGPLPAGSLAQVANVIMRRLGEGRRRQVDPHRDLAAALAAEGHASACSTADV